MRFPVARPGRVSLSRAGVSVWAVTAGAWAAAAVWMLRMPAAGAPAFAGSGAGRFFCSIGLPSHVHGAPAAHASHVVVAFLLMLVAMMLPTLLPLQRYLAATNLRRRRVRVVSCFTLGYFAVWLLAGAGVWLSGRLLGGIFNTAGITRAVTFKSGALLLAVAALWQVSPMKPWLRRRSHSPRPLPLSGVAGDAASLRFGLVHGAGCLGSCWALMLAGLPGSIATMLGLTVLVWLDRGRRLTRRSVVLSAGALCAGALVVLALPG